MPMAGYDEAGRPDSIFISPTRMDEPPSKGLSSNNLDKIALRFGLYLVAAIEQNPETQQRCVEDFVIEPRPKIARR
jgi:hypothetical protein